LLVLKLFSRDRNVIIAPRGEFSVGALQLKRKKKASFLAAAKLIGIYRNITWHASTELEAADIRRVFGDRINPKIRIARDVTATSAQTPNSDGTGGLGVERDPLKVAFISRVSRKKNLHFALQVLHQVEVPVIFNIYGPAEDLEYLVECKDEAARLPEHVVVNFCGGVSHSAVLQVFGQHHLFFFPTLGENYGHVIAEALAAGTPVLLSDQTPWLNLQRHGVGWDFPLSEPASFAAAIKRIALMDKATYVRMRERAAVHSLGPTQHMARDAMVSLFSQT
jgi:glycosyltransferase involved in cell wall biosynthesis